jgi:hypothetical protein
VHDGAIAAAIRAQLAKAPAVKDANPRQCPGAASVMVAGGIGGQSDS